MLSPRPSKYSNSNCSLSSSEPSSRSSSGSPNRVCSDSSDNANKSNDYPIKKQHVQMVKSIVYQCNSCLFQTDKKSLMNRHSRVHLADKRKSMEDCTDATNELNNNKKSNIIELINTVTNYEDNTKKVEKSYCSDCDIQFSSVNTYQHHRNNYCQKYKTIEAVVTVEPPPPPKVLTHSHEGTKKTASPNAVRMGDMVYLPMFKLNEPEITKTSSFPPSYVNLKNENMVLKQFLQSNTKLIQQMNSMQMKQQAKLPSLSPLDLSNKDNDKKQQLLQNQNYNPATSSLFNGHAFHHQHHLASNSLFSTMNMHMMSSMMPNLQFPLIKNQT